MYEEMLQYVKNCLVTNNGDEGTKVSPFPFRKRSDHIRRVFMWAQRLVEDIPSINRKAVLVAAIFHDVGYSVSSDNSKHAKNSAAICKKYLAENGYDTDFINLVVYLVENHSNKRLMREEGTPLELILLMEADLLDETGALSIIWDCMAMGMQEVQTYEKAYNHILKYSCTQLNENPMITTKAKEFWRKKQELISEFVEHLSFDLGL